MEDDYEQRDESRIWLKRAGWLFLAFTIFFLTPYLLTVLSQVTGLEDWSDTFGPLVWWNEANAVPFLMGFVMVIIMMSAIMYLVLQSFSSKEGGW
jgi:hypothetical protein